MKIFLVFLLAFISSYSAFSQQEKFKVDVNWVSAFRFDTIPFPVGYYVSLSQHCTKNAPELLANETVHFSNFYLRGIRFNHFLFFEDTIAKKAFYFFKGKERDSILKLFGLQRENFRQVDKHNYFYFSEKGNVRITCWYDRKKFFYQEEMVGEYVYSEEE